jgi:hypothetical protein
VHAAFLDFPLLGSLANILKVVELDTYGPLQLLSQK